MTAIAIDGPAGAGKSTVARAVARRLGFTYVDTGAMYRAVALEALRSGAPLDDPDALGEMARRLEISATESRVVVDGRDVTEAIRTPDVSEAAARVAAHPRVREALVSAQRAIAARADVVMEGRDIGSRVLPDADVKVFLTASLEERAARRGRDLGADGRALEDVAASLEARDELDSTRAESPLVQVDGAVEVDTTNMSIDDVTEAVVAAARRAAGAR